MLQSTRLLLGEPTGQSWVQLGELAPAFVLTAKKV